MLYYTLAQLFDVNQDDDEDDEPGPAVLFFSRASDTRATCDYVSGAVHMTKEKAFARAAELNRKRKAGAPEIVVVEINNTEPSLTVLDPPKNNGGPRLVH